MKIIGLTGGIGSGKSTIAQFFKELGAVIIDADQIAHELYEKDPTITQTLIKKFGREILHFSHNKIDRKKLGEVVFADSEKRKELEVIIHPLIRLQIEKEIEEAKKNNPPLIIVNAALLVETGFYKLYDGLIVVQATAEQQIERVKKRDQLSEREIEQRLTSQLPLSEKIKLANWVIKNSGDLKETKKQVVTLFNQLVFFL